MAQYFTDFGDDTIGQQPTGWTKRWLGSPCTVETNAGADNGKALKLGPGSPAPSHTLLSWDAIDGDSSRADFEILTRWQSTNENVSFGVGVGAGRCSGDTSATSNGYYGYSVYASFRDRRIASRLAGVTTALGTTADATAASSVWRYSRFRVNGSSLKLKVWTGTLQDEPGWQVEVTNTEISAAGWVGLVLMYGNYVVHHDWIGVGTGGDAAPSGPVGGANTQVTTSPGSLALSGPAPSSAFSGAVTSAPGVGALTITPQAAEILFSGAITSAPEPGLLDLAGKTSQSAFSGAITSATLPGSLAFSGLAGQIIVSGAATVTVLTAAGALSLTGAAPSAAYSGTMRAQTLPGLLALAGVAPGLLHSGAVTVELLAGELSIDGQAVETTIGGGIRVETAAGLLSLLGNAPSVVISGGVRVETQPGSLALTGAAPVMIHAGLIEIVTAAGVLSIEGLPVTVSAGERLGPIFAPGLHSITVQRAVLSVTPVRGLRRFDGH